ncbi:MAG: hypothetical protein DME57_11140 [Verrucomicrobia bacterium]|nr:MAG: hypothetical protein DME57_11140 [Verrucomicrobiota bacterium]
MKTSTRFLIFAVTVFLCVAGIFVANSTSRKDVDLSFATSAEASGGGEYQLAVSQGPKLTFQELERIIRRDPIAKAQRGKLEFGSVKVEQGSAVAEVMFVSDDGRVQPFLYKLLPERDSWKIVNVQRMWFVPRSRLLRGVRA